MSNFKLIAVNACMCPYYFINLFLSNFINLLLMKLTEEQLVKAQKKLIFPVACPNCGCTEQKLIDPNCFELISHDVQNGCVNFGGKMTYQPLLSVRCPRCAYTSLFNLKALGVLDI